MADEDNAASVAERIAALAGPGEIHLSGAARDAAQGDAALACLDLGERILPGSVAPLRLFQIAGDHERREEGLELPDKPSIAVLAFQNLSGDPEQEYFADGMVEDIITALSRIRWLFVIARNSSFTYKGRAVDVKQISRELGVRYVLEGSVRKAANRVRITCQLIDAAAALRNGDRWKKLVDWLRTVDPDRRMVNEFFAELL